MITFQGSTQSVSKDGRKAQIAVKTGAYRGTYHAELATDRGSGILEWHTIPNKTTGDQYAIITGYQDED